MINRSALVDFIPGGSLGVIAALMVRSDAEAGVPQQDAVQLAAELQAFRSALAHPGVMQAALVKNGKIAEVRYMAKIELPKGFQAVFPIVGDEALAKDPDDRAVMLAIDDVLTEIAKAPTGGIAHASPIIAPAGALAVIVTGIAVTIAATTAIWRYFNPDLRARLAALAAAAAAYQARLQVLQATGKMPPASDIEKAAPIAAAASAQKGRDWGWGLALAVGVPVGVIGMTWLNRAIARG